MTASLTTYTVTNLLHMTLYNGQMRMNDITRIKKEQERWTHICSMPHLHIHALIW